jgi:SET domain-containing protein
VIRPSRGTPAVEVRAAGDKGIGVFAAAPIRRHQLITRCVGRVVRSVELSPDHSAVQIGADLWIASPGDALDDWINHSCEPNIGFVTGEPVFYALRSIERGEELVWDYSTSLTERDWRLRCRCGASACRRVVRPFAELPADHRSRLLPVSLRYIRRAMGARA